MARWAQSGILDYHMEITRSCECTHEAIGPVHLTVKQGKVVERRYAKTGRLVAPEYHLLFPDVNGLLEHVAEAYSRNAFSVETQFDETTGHPKKISIDYEPRIVDEESNYTIEKFAALPTN